MIGKKVFLKCNSLAVLLILPTFVPWKEINSSSTQISHCLHCIRLPLISHLQAFMGGHLQKAFLLVSFSSKSSCSELLAVAPTCSDPFWSLHPAMSFSFSHFWGFQSSCSSEPSPSPLFMQPFPHCPARHTCFPCVPRLLGLALALYHFPPCVLMICDHSSSPLVKCKASAGWGSALSNCAFPSRISPVLREIFVR